LGAEVNVLIIGSGKGSWSIRGLQLGDAIGARVTSSPSPGDFAWAEIIVLVKHAITNWGVAAKQTGAAIVWDALDFWPQSHNGATEREAMEMLHAKVRPCPPDLIIAATESMATAIGGYCLPHHSWPGMSATPAREHVRTVVYEGSDIYLGRWAEWLHDACAARGWHFKVNPPHLTEADIIVAFRDRQWDGWICREWKSGVKAGNAIVAGRPLLMQDCASRRELQPAGSLVETREDLAAALDYWTPYDVRAAVVDAAAARAPRFHLASVAATYRSRLEAVACPA
jgi:hypothetical protein